MSRPRIACAFCPLFPLAARLRAEPELTTEAVVVVEGNGHAARVVAATRAARRAGIRPGSTLVQARALMPKLVARARDPECEETAKEVMLEIAESFSPRVEDAEPGVVYLDLEGLERIHRSAARRSRVAAAADLVDRGTGDLGARDRGAGDIAGGVERAGASGPRANRADEPIDPERELGKALVHALDSERLPARVGIASNKLAARMAAGIFPTPTLVAPGEEELFLAPLPLERLAPQLEIAQTLERWGLRSIGEFARLPAAEVASRLGEVGRELHASARGLDLHPLVPRATPPDFREGMTLEWPLVNLEPFLFLARAALDRLCRRLEIQGLGCARLDLALRLEPDGVHERSLQLPSPTRDAKTLLTLVRLDLEQHTPGAPVVGFAFTAQPDRPRAAQLSIFGPAALSPELLATTLARLFALLGPGRVGSPRTADGHRPERFALADFRPPPPPDVRERPPRARGLLAVRVLRPAIELKVSVDGGGRGDGDGDGDGDGNRRQAGDEGADGGEGGDGRDGRDAGSPRPVFVEPLTRPVIPAGARAAVTVPPRSSADGRGAPVSRATALVIEGAVRVASGPWDVEEGWWTEQPVRREYWDVEIEGGGIYRIYREVGNERWFLDGIYD